MECALLEREKDWILGVASCAFGKHVDALALLLNLVGSAGHGLTGVFAVLAVDKDGCAEAHEPAEEGSLAQRGLGRHTAVLGEDTAEHEHVKLRLVVADEDGRASCLQVALWIHGMESDARREDHEVFEEAPCGPLCDLTVSHQPQKDGYKDAEHGGVDQANIRGQGASHEGRLGYCDRQHVECDNKSSITGVEVE